MLHSISWSEFIWTITITLGIYYLLVCTIYFRSDLLHLFRKNNLLSLFSTSDFSFSFRSKKSPVTEATNTDNQTDIAFSVVHDFLEDLKKLLEQTKSLGQSKDWFIAQLKPKLSHVHHLRYSPVKHDLDNHICLEAREIAQLDLSPEDLEALWLG